MSSAPLTTKMPVVRSAKLPATGKPSVPDLRPFNAFVARCDDLAYWYDDLASALSGSNLDQQSLGDHEEARDNGFYKQKVAACREGFAVFDPQDRYDDGGLDRDHIATRLGVMISTIPSANAHAPEGFAPMLVAHVQAFEGLDALVLESACRELEQTIKFTITVPEMLAALTKHAKLSEERRWAIDEIEERINFVIERLIIYEAKKREDGIARQRSIVGYAEQRLINIRKQKADLCAKLEQQIADARKCEAELSAKVREERGKLFELEYEDAEAINEQMGSNRTGRGT